MPNNPAAAVRDSADTPKLAYEKTLRGQPALVTGG